MVPNRENFSLAFFALSEPIWACDVGTEKKIEIFYQLTADFDVYWFFLPHTECAVNKKKIEARLKLKVGYGCF
jgi:hypothetical protein